MLKKYFSGLSRNSYLLTFASLFADISTEMLYPILPIFLVQTLKTGGSIVGLIDGIAQATQNIIQGFSGYLSDKLQKRKPIALAGYILATLSKPLIGLAPSWQFVLGARFLDRTGTGTRSAPRDALIASSVIESNRGKAFGIEGVGDNLGAFLGPLLTIGLLFYLFIDIRTIFYIAVIPGILAILMMSFVQDRKITIKAKSKLDLNLKKFSTSYFEYLSITAIFGLGASSSSFLILQTKSLGVSLEITILIYAFFNLVAAFSSYPSGFLSDKLGRKKLLLFCFFTFLITYLGFALTSNIYLIALFFLLYGVFQGMFRSVGKAFATDLVPLEFRASGIGWYSTVVGISGLIASVIAGLLWDKVGHQAVFSYGVIFSALGILALLIFVPKKVEQTI